MLTRKCFILFLISRNGIKANGAGFGFIWLAIRKLDFWLFFLLVLVIFSNFFSEIVYHRETFEQFTDPFIMRGIDNGIDGTLLFSEEDYSWFCVIFLGNGHFKKEDFAIFFEDLFEICDCCLALDAREVDAAAVIVLLILSLLGFEGDNCSLELLFMGIVVFYCRKGFALVWKDDVSKWEVIFWASEHWYLLDLTKLVEVLLNKFNDFGWLEVWRETTDKKG